MKQDPKRSAVLLVVLAAAAGGVPVTAAERPVLEYAWTCTFGGPGEDHLDAVAVDDQGGVFVAGHFDGTVDFDPGPSEDYHTSHGRHDIFITKLNANGGFRWTRTLGGEGDDLACDLAVDNQGNILVTGWFRSTVDFDPTAGVDQHTAYGGYEDVFVTKLLADGSYGWTQTFGGGNSDRGGGVATDSAGNVLVTGSFHNSVDFDPGPGLVLHTSNGGYDIFLSKLSGEGSHLWTRTMGGKASDHGFAVTVDPDGNPVITGTFWHTVDFDPGAGTDEHTDGGGYVTKLNVNGTYAWTRSFGAYKNAAGWGIAAGPDGGVAVAGTFFATANFDKSHGYAYKTSAGGADLYVLKLESDGTLAWVYNAGGWKFDAAYDVAIAPWGDVLATGYYDANADFDPSGSEDIHATRGYRDVFLVRLAGDGTYLETLTLGGTGVDDAGHAIAVSPAGHVLYGGRYESALVDFDPTESADHQPNAGSFDGFVTKLVGPGAAR